MLGKSIRQAGTLIIKINKIKNMKYKHIKPYLMMKETHLNY
jgi:hypothetical protein